MHLYVYRAGDKERGRIKGLFCCAREQRFACRKNNHIKKRYAHPRALLLHDGFAMQTNSIARFAV